jgi:diguanylate cyclase (GGDEF)-like protein
MSLIDPRTVLMLTGVMSGLMSLVMYVLKRNYPSSIKGLREWSAALLVLFAGGLLVSGVNVLPDFLAISVSTFLLWTGLFLGYVGTQRFYGLVPRPGLWMVFIAGMQLVQVWFTVAEPSYPIRMMLTTVMTASLTGVHARLVFKQGSLTFARALAFGVLIALAAIQLLRLLTAYQLTVNASFLDTSAMQLMYITGFAFAILLFAISMVLMATERLHAEFERLATHDSLTEAFTRRHMNEACQQELERCRRHGHVMSFLVMDLDNFKAINDTHGHQAGDRVLVEFVTRIKALLRRSDQLGRFGGEEFVLLLPETPLEVALVVAERIRALAEQSDPAVAVPHCTVSIGVTTNRLDSDTLDSLLARADAAMYRAKEKGRNRVETA